VAVVHILDVSERKRLEDELQRLREEIEAQAEAGVKRASGHGLTFREITVLSLIARGKSDKQIAAKVANYGAEVWHMAEKSLLLQLLDQAWKDHLLTLDHLRQGIGLRAYGQRDPLNEYKREAFDLFEKMLDALRGSVTTVLSHLELRIAQPESDFEPEERRQMQESRPDPTNGEDRMPLPPPSHPFGAGARVAPEMRSPADPTTWGKVGRNERCPCGSGKKFKHCHGKVV
jgi:preprotein translocase subunit SecA